MRLNSKDEIKHEKKSSNLKFKTRDSAFQNVQVSMQTYEIAIQNITLSTSIKTQDSV